MLQILLKIKDWETLQLNFFLTKESFAVVGISNQHFFLHTIWLVNCKVAYRSMQSRYSLASLGEINLFSLAEA